MKTFAIIAAAGRGTRLDANVPKAAFKVKGGDSTLLELAIEKFRGLGIEPYCVVSQQVIECLGSGKDLGAEFFIQDVPTGMGDALFVASSAIKEADRILFTWVDQVGLTPETIWETASALSGVRGFIVPCWSPNKGYTGIAWNSSGVERVFQKREGEAVPTDLPTDVGLFGFTGGAELVEEWRHYRAQAKPGVRTGEYNFLDFLPWVTAKKWSGSQLPARISDTYSINTPAEAETWETYGPVGD